MKIKQAASTIVTAVVRELRKMPRGQIIFVSNTVAIYSKTTSLTAAQIRALDLTPITLVPTPGTNRVLVPATLVLSYVAGSTAYAATGGGIAPHINIGYPGTDLYILTDQQTFLTQSASSLITSAATYFGPAAPTGAAGQPLQVANASFLSYNAGPITATSIAAPGTGYAANDTGTIDLNGTMADTSDATYKVLTVNGSGAVLTYQIVVAGTIYSVTTANLNTGPYPTNNGGAQAGVGTGFTLNVTSVTSGNGTLKIAVTYAIADVS